MKHYLSASVTAAAMEALWQYLFSSVELHGLQECIKLATLMLELSSDAPENATDIVTQVYMHVPDKLPMC